MRTRTSFVLVGLLLLHGCGSDKHLPSSNPPEYEPQKVYTVPAVPFQSATLSTTPIELDSLRSKLDSLEPGQKPKGEGKKVPFDLTVIQLFKGVTTPCEALSRLAPGLGSAQLFTGKEGAALKKALGPDADGIARRMDEQVAESLKQSLGPGAADCPISARPQKMASLFQPARLVLTHASPSHPFLLAQATIPDTSQDDYHVDDPRPRREHAPPEWVGWKTTDTMKRIGKEDRPTKGISEAYEMIIAPKAKHCPRLGPDPEGIVDGTFEWSFVMFRTTPDSQPVLYRRHVMADLWLISRGQSTMRPG